MATGPNGIHNARSPSKLRREDFADTAVSIEQDFRRLVQTLQVTLESIDPSDAELLQQISSTKTVADRGLRLSKMLTKLARDKRG